MKPFQLFILLNLFMVSQAQDIDKNTYHKVKHDFDSLQESIIPLFIEKEFPANWSEKFRKVIQEQHPDIKLKNSDKLDYLIVPSLSIPIENFNNYKGNFLSHLKQGKMELDNSYLMLFKNDSLQIIFTIKEGYGMGKDGIYTSDANDYLRNIDLNTLKQANLLFKINLTNGSGTFPIPGIVLKSENKLEIISADGKIFPIQEFYKVNWKTIDEFDHYISITVEAAAELRSSSN